MNPPKKRILLVEDDRHLREIYVDQLKKAQFLVDEFDNGKEALAAIKANKYDLILLDIMMPGLNGVALMKHMKSDARLRDIPVYFLTNLEKHGILEEGMRMGANGYLIKSDYTPYQLVEKIQEIVEEEY